jgi:hypothetical protein
MNMISKSALALGLAVCLAGPALAQQGQRRGGGFGGGGNISMLLANASVQQELKLDEAQINKAKELADQTREKMTAAREANSSLEGEERFKKMRELNTELNESANKTASEFLKPEQMKRLHQIQHQQQGASAFEMAHVQTKLKLTDDQKKEIGEIIQASNQEMRSIFAASQGDREGAMTKITELRKETLSKVEAKLTDEQKTAYKEMLGAPFEVKREPRPGQ